MKKLLWLVLCLSIAMLVQAQDDDYEINITQVDSSHFPEIQLWVSVVDAQGNPVTNLNSADFSLSENGQAVTINNVSQSRTEASGGLNVVLAIDRSGSMNEYGKLRAAQVAAIDFVERMRPEDKTALLVFNNEVELVQPLTSDKTALIQAINEIEAFEDTSMYDGLSMAMDSLANVEGRRVIILLSDGLDNLSHNTADDILGRVERSELSIYAIGLGDSSLGVNSRAGIDEAALQMIAQESRGTYTYATDAESLSALYEELSFQLQNEYLLSYTSTNTLRDGLGRNLEVQVRDAGSLSTIYNPGGLIPETIELAAWPLFGVLLAVLLLLLFLPRLIPRSQANTGSTGKSSAAKPRIKLTNPSNPSNPKTGKKVF